MESLTKFEDTELYLASQKLEEVKREYYLLSEKVDDMVKERIEYLKSLRKEIMEKKRNFIEKKVDELFQQRLAKSRTGRYLGIGLEEEVLKDEKVLEEMSEINKEEKIIQKELEKICNKFGYEIPEY